MELLNSIGRESKEHALDDRGCLTSTADLVLRLRGKGVTIWVEDGRVCYRTVKGVLTQQEIDALRRRKSEIIDYFQTSNAHATAEPPLVPQPDPNPAPLTFSQQWLWNVQGRQIRSFRTVYTAVRIAGPLDLDVLRLCVPELLSRHESLRTRILLTGDVPLQEVAPVTRDGVEIVALSGCPEDDRERRAQALIGTLICTPITLTSDPLWKVLVLEMSDEEHVLALAMDHLISDAVSIRILLRELLQAYTAAVRGVRLCLPKTSIQYRDYALWQQRQQSFWSAKNESFWRRQLAEGRRVPLFPGIPSDRTTLEFHSFPIQLTEKVSAALRSLSRQEATTLVMMVLCTYVALLLRWSNQSTLIVPFITMGRSRPELDNLIGYFAAPLFLRIELAENDSFLDLLKYVTQTYWEACEHDDFGRIAAQFPAPEFEPNSSFNWIPSEFTSADESFTDDLREGCVGSEIRVQPFSIGPLPQGFDWEGAWDREPVVFFTENRDGIYGEIGWTGSSVSAEAIERFAKNFQSVAEAFVRDPTVAVTSVSCVR